MSPWLRVHPGEHRATGPPQGERSAGRGLGAGWAPGRAGSAADLREQGLPASASAALRSFPQRRDIRQTRHAPF